MAVDIKFINIKLQDVCSNLGALFLIIGTLQWFFDENSRQGLIDEINKRLDEREMLRTSGVEQGLENSKEITIQKQDIADLKSAAKVVIGIHYSDGTIVRYEDIIKSRIKANKTTQILHTNPKGSVSKHYLENSLAAPVDLSKKIDQLMEVLKKRFGDKLDGITLTTHDRVLRYSFVYCERFIWIIFMTNSSNYCAQVPALKIHVGTPLFQFFQEDILGLGATL